MPRRSNMPVRYLTDEKDNIIGFEGVAGQLLPLSIDALTPAKLAVQLAPLLPSSRYKASPNSATNPIFDTTPTHFFDPTAGGSSVTGTLANPFNTLAQVEAYFNTTLNGLAYGKVLGMKRGTSVRGKLELLVTGFGNSSRLSDNPFMIVPYGNAEAAPKIIGAIQVGGTAAPQWSFDGAFWFYDTGTSREVDAFQDGQRLYKKANRAAALAAGSGYSYWVANRLFVLPYRNSDNLNNAQTLVEVQSAFGAIATNMGHVVLARYKNQARTGNIIIAGIEAQKAINSNFSIQSSSFNLITFCDTLQIIGCTSRDAGADQTSVGAGSDGIVVTGPSDTVRASNVYIGGNYIENCLNNAVEINGVSSGLIEWNTSIGCGGNNIAELFASCSNVRTQYNVGYGAGDYAALTSANFNGGGYWVAGYVWDQTNGDNLGNTDVTKNINNDVYFNVSLNCRNISCSYDAGTGGKIQNNVFHSIGVVGGSSTGSPAAQIGSNPNMTLTSSADFSNNVVLNGGQDNVTMQVGKFSGTTRNCALTGDNNFYWNIADGFGRNSTISTVNNSGATVAASNLTYTNIESWTAGFAAGGNTIDSNGRMNDPKISFKNGHPQFGSPLMARRPIMPTGFYTDLSGRPILTAFVGAYQV